MTTKPSVKPIWASQEENDPITGAVNKQKPSEEFQLSGLKRKQPLLRRYLNWQLNNISEWIEYFDKTISSISEDKTIYVDLSGDDVNGDGTQLNPYRTPNKAFQSLEGVSIGDCVVTISCGEGEYDLTNIKVNNPYANRIVLKGSPLKGNPVTGLPLGDWSSDLESPTTSARTTTEFFNSSGILPVSLTEEDRLLAIKQDLNNNKDILKNLYGTVFSFRNDSGLTISSGTNLSSIQDILFVGDWDGETSTKDLKGLEVKGSLLSYKNLIFIGWRGEGVVVEGSVTSTGETLSSLCNSGNNIDITTSGSFLGGHIVASSGAAKGIHNEGVLNVTSLLSNGNITHGYYSKNGNATATSITCQGNGVCNIESVANSYLNAESTSNTGSLKGFILDENSTALLAEGYIKNNTDDVNCDGRSYVKTGDTFEGTFNCSEDTQDTQGDPYVVKTIPDQEFLTFNSINKILTTQENFLPLASVAGEVMLELLVAEENTPITTTILPSGADTTSGVSGDGFIINWTTGGTVRFVSDGINKWSKI